MRFDTPEGALDLEIRDVIVAGWTGRDKAAVEHHIAELAEIGVPAPSTVPLYYRVSRNLLTQADTIQVLGTATSGEIEPLIVKADGRLWLGVASDHTDRELENVSVAASKQACAKPVGRSLWPLTDVQDRLDDLTLSCWIEEDGGSVLYQQGTLASIRPLQELLEGAALGDGSAMLCGTLGAQGGIRPAGAYRMELSDPASGGVLRLAYSVTPLPVIS